MENVTESLAGRAKIVKMNRFIYSEIIKNTKKEVFDPNHLKQKEYMDVNEVFERIFNGGMPELYDIENMDRNEFYYSYINTYIEKDIKKIKNIVNIEDFKKFMRSELIKSYENKGVHLEISHFRNKETEEIDLIIFKNNTLYPLEIKKTANPKKSMMKNFKYLEKTNMKIGTGEIICLYDKLMKLDNTNYIIPVSSVIN